MSSFNVYLNLFPIEFVVEETTRVSTKRLLEIHMFNPAVVEELRTRVGDLPVHVGRPLEQRTRHGVCGDNAESGQACVDVPRDGGV
jgi:hypothetical protein